MNDPILYLALFVVGFFVLKQVLASRNRIDGAAARSLVDAGAFLLDVRTEGEFAGGHLDGAVNIPVQSLGSRMGELPTSGAVVIYCASGMRSAQAARVLKAAKRVEVHDLGPMGAW